MYTHVYTVVHTEVSNVEEQSFKMEGSTIDPDPNVTPYWHKDSIVVGPNKYYYIDTMIIDFGTTGSTWAGKTKKGKIRITKDKQLITPTCITKVELINFYIDGKLVEGTATLENKGLSGNELTLQADVVGGKITNTDQTFATWDATRTVLIQYFPTNVYATVSGNSTGCNHLGTTYSSTISDSDKLKFVHGCKYPLKGVVTLTETGKPNAVVNFGGGTGGCDNIAVVTVNGVKFKITLD